MLLAMNNLNSSEGLSVRITIAQPEDAERITNLINSAFRPAEGFFVEGDRIDVSSVLNFLSSGKFLLAESEGALLGSVYVEARIGKAGKTGPGKGETEHVDSNSSMNIVRALECQPGITLAPSEDRAYLGLLAVDPAHQQSGLGSTLMDAAEDYCRRLGFGFMDIKVVSLREELFAFYRKRGYVETGTSAFPAEVETKMPCHFIDMSKPLKRSTDSADCTD